MNFLAHLALAGPDPEWQIGGLIADFSRPANEVIYSPAIREGIRLHRAIDRFTDQHPVVRRSREQMTPAYRRAAGILVDVFYDHFLAVTWHEYFPAIGLETFSQNIYSRLRSNDAVLPDLMKPLVARMIAENWLVKYRDAAYISVVVDRIATRLSRPALLLGGAVELERRRDQFIKDFREFFPEVIAFADAHRQASH